MHYYEGVFMRTKQNVLMLSLLVSSVGIFLTASDRCGVINVDFNGTPNRIYGVSKPASLDGILGAFGYSGEEVLVQLNGQYLPVEVIQKTQVDCCDRISISTKKS
jgi:sulfur carrier protein ThiS